MARTKNVSKKAPAKKPRAKKPVSYTLAQRIQVARRWVRRWVIRGILGVIALGLIGIVAFSFINPPHTLYMRSEALRIGEIDQEWVAIEGTADVLQRSIVAAEDANFCAHWGFDMAAIRSAVAQGGQRGASTLSQQVVKNVYLWHGRSYVRKALEALITPLVELTWSKRRILEVYMNVAEFDEGIFGVEAASRHYFGKGPEELSNVQAARLAAILPSPKRRSASKPTAKLRRRAAQILDGAATIGRDGRAACFQD